MHRGSAEMFDHARRSTPVLEVGAQDGVGTLEVGVEPQAVQFAAEPLSDQFQAGRQGFDGRAIGDEHHLRGLRAALHDHLQITRQAQMRLIRVAGHFGVGQGAPHDRGDAVDQGMLNAAVRDVNHAMRAELEQPDLRRAQPAADGEARAEPKTGGLTGNHRDLRQAVNACQLLERTAGGRGEAVLTEARAAGAGRAVRARRRLARLHWARLRCARLHCAQLRAGNRFLSQPRFLSRLQLRRRIRDMAAAGLRTLWPLIT